MVVVWILVSECEYRYKHASYSGAEVMEQLQWCNMFACKNLPERNVCMFC